MDTFASLFEAFSESLMAVLPRSPFQEYIAAFADMPFLGWLNWFVPVRAILVVCGSWLGAVGLFYLYSIVMRWLKVIGD